MLALQVARADAADFNFYQQFARPQRTATGAVTWRLRAVARRLAMVYSPHEENRGGHTSRRGRDERVCVCVHPLYVGSQHNRAHWLRSWLGCGFCDGLSAEYHKDQTVEELADLMEVIRAVAVARGYTLEELEQIRADKATKRGGFEKRILLKEVYED